jgi:hypothetical protein
MLEATTNPAARKGIEAAHVERAQAIKDAFAWLFPSKTSR